MSEKQNKSGDKGAPAQDGALKEKPEHNRRIDEGIQKQHDKGYIVSEQQPHTTPKRPPAK